MRNHLKAPSLKAPQREETVNGTFLQGHGFTHYHYVQLVEAPRYPYGVCGPFASEPEADEAMRLIGTALPAVDLCLEEAGFAGDASRMLAEDSLRARQRLSQLRT